ncbi:CCR4-NOT transcription complex family protein [Hibiscus syriacus]|uniref:CCR4-NOT transcription complex family protein n=1 Tax=Hibiscus syriacus TaxID=106335 RepID=A0A6A2XLE0_HIBSY|nr:CCR4-NOT transcription complex family protein [Hibiscus syriacus]
MSRRSDSPEPDSMLNLAPARVANHRVRSPSVSVPSFESLSESSCLSSEPDNNNCEDSTSMTEYPTGRPEVTSMLLVGCPRCFMYVMLSEVDPKCPRCKSTVFLDFLNEENAKWTKN